MWLQVGTIEAQDRARSRLEDERRRAGGAAMLGEPSGAGDTSGSEAEDAASTSGQDARGGWGLSGAFLLGIRSMGRAVQISGKVVEAVSSEAHSALGRYVKVRRDSSVLHAVADCPLRCAPCLRGGPQGAVVVPRRGAGAVHVYRIPRGHQW